MSTLNLQSRVSTRSVKKLDKPKPLKVNVPQSRSDNRLSSGGVPLEEVMSLADSVCQLILTERGGNDRTLQNNVLLLSSHLSLYGQQLEAVYKDQLDRLFVTLRNGSLDEKIDYVSRLNLLELVELRGAQWAVRDNMTDYYKHKASHTYQHSHSNEERVPVMDSPVTPTGSIGTLGPLGNLGPLSGLGMTQASAPTTPQPPILGPGEVLKTSGKFLKPTKIPNKNYCKDEVVIRNSDSGKVSPGAKERLVQITGPSEEKIIHARQLMEDTIRRNASPIRPEQPERDSQRDALGGSSSSLNSSASDDSNRVPHTGARHTTLLHSFSTNDAHLGEYKYTVAVGGSVLKITGSDHDLVRAAKLYLDDRFANHDPNYISSYEEDLPSPPSSAPATVTVAPVNITTAAIVPATGSVDSSTSESDETIKTGITAQIAGCGGVCSGASLVQEGSELDSAVRTSVRRSLISDDIDVTPESVEARSETDEGVISREKVEIVRQPLFPCASKEAFQTAESSTRYEDAMATLRRNLFSRKTTSGRAPELVDMVDSDKDNGRALERTSAGIGGSLPCRYSLEALLKLSTSSLSRAEPADWLRISRDFPSIIKKVVEPFEPSEYRRVADRECPVVTCEETGSPDPE